MKITGIINNTLRIFMLVSLAWLATGCLRSNLSDCPTGSFSFTVKAVDPDGNEIHDQVNNVLLYVFNGEGKFIRKIETNIGSTVLVDDAVGNHITIVAWGNAKGADNVLPAEISGTDITNFSMSAVKNGTRAAENYRPTADLFWGRITASVSSNSVTIPIVMRRVTGNASVQITKIKEYAGFNDNNFSVVVREVRCALDFSGKPIGEKQYVRPAGSFDAQDIYKTETFNLFPQPEGIVVEIYHGNDLIYSAEKDSDGNLMVLEAEKRLNIKIDFGGTIIVKATLESWENNDINKTNKQI